MKRVIRTNKWHAVSVAVRRNNLGPPFGIEWELRINSEPTSPSTAAYLTPAKARDLADALKAAAKLVEKKNRKAGRHGE